MSWLHRLQQRLSITKNEALTLLSLSLFLLLGAAGRYTCRQMRPVSPEYYARIDSLFAERSAAVLHPDAENFADIRSAGVLSPPSGMPPSDSLEAQNPGAASSQNPGDPASARRSGDPPPERPFGDASGGRPAAALPAARPSGAPPAEPADIRRGATAAAQIDLNRATLNELEQLPRVGPKIAERIIAFREAYGSFRSVDELLSVSGIGPKTLEYIRPHAKVVLDSTR